MAHVLDEDREHRDDDNADGDEREVLLDDRHVPEQQPGRQTETHPPRRAREVVDEKRGDGISAAPATNGTNVRTMGTNRPRITALPPYCTKNTCARRRCARLSRRWASPRWSVALKMRG